MQFYWTLRGIPELQGLDWLERGQCWRRALWKALTSDAITAVAFLAYLMAFVTVTAVSAELGVHMIWRLSAIPIVVVAYHLVIQARVRRFIEPVRPARRKVLLDAEHTGDQ